MKMLRSKSRVVMLIALLGGLGTSTAQARTTRPAPGNAAARGVTGGTPTITRARSNVGSEFGAEASGADQQRSETRTGAESAAVNADRSSGPNGSGAASSASGRAVEGLPNAARSGPTERAWLQTALRRAHAHAAFNATSLGVSPRDEVARARQREDRARTLERRHARLLKYGYFA